MLLFQLYSLVDSFIKCYENRQTVLKRLRLAESSHILVNESQVRMLVKAVFGSEI